MLRTHPAGSTFRVNLLIPAACQQLKCTAPLPNTEHMQQVKLRSVAVGRSRAALVPPGHPAAYFAPRQLAAHAASTPPAWNPQNVPNPKVRLNAAALAVTGMPAPAPAAFVAPTTCSSCVLPKQPCTLQWETMGGSVASCSAPHTSASDAPPEQQIYGGAAPPTGHAQPLPHARAGRSSADGGHQPQ